MCTWVKKLRSSVRHVLRSKRGGTSCGRSASIVRQYDWRHPLLCPTFLLPFLPPFPSLLRCHLPGLLFLRLPFPPYPHDPFHLLLLLPCRTRSSKMQK